MASLTHYQENGVALNAVGNLKNQLDKISTWTDDLIKPKLVLSNVDGAYGQRLKEVGTGYTLESCNQACLKIDWCTYIWLGITNNPTSCWV